MLTCEVSKVNRDYNFLSLSNGGFPAIGRITRSHVFTKEINHASTRSQYFNENFHCKNCPRMFSAMAGTHVFRTDYIGPSVGAIQLWHPSPGAIQPIRTKWILKIQIESKKVFAP